jgi:hypothetical protein
VSHGSGIVQRPTAALLNLNRQFDQRHRLTLAQYLTRHRGRFQVRITGREPFTWPAFRLQVELRRQRVYLFDGGVVLATGGLYCVVALS